jgi:hypothetical protein
MYFRDGCLELLHEALAFEFAAPPVRDVLIDDDCPDDIPVGISQGEGRVQNRLAGPSTSNLSKVCCKSSMNASHS